jgi:SPP1 gp7 family putative phage head morphogenesis protein
MSEVTFKALPNQAAIDYLKTKVPQASAHWDDWLAPVHAKSFTVAGAPSVAFAEEMHAAVVSAITNGTTITAFRREFDTIVQKHGWTYNGKRGWRTNVIFNTNMRTARMAAKWQTIQANKDVAPYLEYDAVNDSRTRPEHKTWDGTVLPVDDAFWDTHYPPNGWGCRCTVRQVSGATLRREGKSVSASPQIERRNVSPQHPNIPKGIDAGWDNNVGQAWLAPDVALGNKLAALPPSLAGYAYEHMVTKPFMSAVDKAWAVFSDGVKTSGRPKNATQFVGFASHKVQAGLMDKAEAILLKTAEINAARAASLTNNLPQLPIPDLKPESLALLAPDFKVAHLTGAHKTGSASQWPSEWTTRLPSLLHDYQAVLYDTDAQALVYVTKAQNNGRFATAYVNINQIKKKMGVSNWVGSLNTKPLSNLGESRFILLDGELPK